MGYLPIVNAVLLSISSSGTIEDYDSPAGADSVTKFQGVEDALVVEQIMTVISSGPGAQNKVKDTKIIISNEITPAVSIETDDTVVYQYQGKTWTRQVADYNTIDYPGASVPVVTIHLRPGTTL